MTTLANFYTSFQGLSLSGVTNLSNPPTTIDSVNLPCKWVDSLSTENNAIRANATGKVVGGARVIRCRVVVAINPPGQDLRSSRWSDVRAMSDTLDTAIKALARPSRGALSWNVSVTPDLDGSGYFAITAEVEGQDIGG